MRLAELLRPEHVVVPLAADDLGAALVTLLSRLEESGAAAVSEELRRRLREDRRRDLVRIGDAVQVVHARTDAVGQVQIAIGVDPSSAERRGRAVVLILAPPSAVHPYLAMVHALAQAFRTPEVAERLLAARSVEEVLAAAALAGTDIGPGLRVRDVMTTDVVTITPDRPVGEAVALFAARRVGALPVVGADGECLGLVTERDLLRHFLPALVRAGGAEPREALDRADAGLRAAPVRDIMTRAVVAVSEDQALAEAVSLMINKGVERVPVLRDGRLVGFLTGGDVIRRVLR